jgi:hypothetical protein
MNKTTIAVKPVWDEIEKARVMAEAFLTDNDITDETAYKILMIMSELIENGIKYGQFQETATELKTNITLLDDSIIIEVIHPTTESSTADLKKLDTIIQWIRSYQDPFEAYVGRLEEVAQRALQDTESGLGLVRIAYEGGAVLDFIVDENGYLNVTAVIR